MTITEDAKGLLEDLDLYSVPVNPREVCKKLKITYDEQPFSGFDGLLLVEGDRQLIGVSSKILEVTRKAFTCAHELGHYYYDLSAGGLIRCNRDDLGYGKQQLAEMEKRANQFASELLLPAEYFLKDIAKQEPSWRLVQQLAEKYKTSLQATITRYVNLTHHSCWLVVARAGKLQRFVKAEHNEFLIDLSGRWKGTTTDTADWLNVSADNWLYANRRTKEKELLLWPLPENQYGESLMLLWDQNNALQEEAYVSEDDDRDHEDDDGYRW